MDRQAQPDNPRTTWPQKLAVLAVMSLLALAMTWPLAAHLKTAINDFGDPLLNSWIMWWDIKALSTSGLSLFNAPIFHPSPLTLAYSEHLLTSALTAAPVLLSGGDPILAHNLVFLASFVLAGFGAYLLGYELTGSRAAALITGLGFAFAPFRFAHLGHLQLLTSHFMPLVLLFLHRWQKSPRWPLAIAMGFFWLLQMLSCAYYGLFTALAVGLFLVYYGLGQGWWRDTRRWLQMAAVVVVLGLLLLPVMAPYFQVKHDLGFVRTSEQAASFAAEPRNYLAAPPANRLYGPGTARFRGAEGELFLGLTLAGLALLAFMRRGGPALRHPSLARGLLVLAWVTALAGGFLLLSVTDRIRLGSWSLGPDTPLAFLGAALLLLAAWRVSCLGGLAGAQRAGTARLLGIMPAPASQDGPYQDLGYYLLLGLFAAWASLGPNFGLYAVLYHLFPGFAALRVPARLAVLVTLALSVLAGFGMRGLMAWLGVRRWPKALACALAAGFILLESCSVPIPWLMVHHEPALVYKWLAKQKPAVVMELPTLGYMGDFARDARYLYWSTKHGHTLINGYSGFFPPRYMALTKEANRLPQGQALAQLRKLGANYLVVHLKEYPRARQDGILQGLKSKAGLKLVWSSRWDYVFAFELAPPAGKAR